MGSQGKLLVTPVVDLGAVERLVGGALKFRLPKCASHLVVVELRKLPTADVFPAVVRTYGWAPQDERHYGNHAHTAGQELFVCDRGKIHVRLHDGAAECTVVLGHGEALFIPLWVWHEVWVGPEGGGIWVHADVPYDREAHYKEDFEAFCTTARARVGK